MNSRAAAPHWGFASVALLAATLSGMLHFVRLDDFPRGAQRDESGIGYNAYCVANTGADEYGVRYPVFFRGFDNYHNPVMVYVAAGLFRLFGPGKALLRSVSGVFHLLAALAFGLLAFEFLRSRWLALAGAFLFSVLPWLFPVSRLCMGGYMPMLLGLNLAIYLTLRAFRQRAVGLGVVAGAAWAFTMYAHHIGRPMGVVAMLCGLVAFNRLLWRRWRVALALGAAFLVTMTPMAIAVSRSHAPLTERFGKVSVFRDEPGAAAAAARLTRRYLEYFGPGFLFVKGDRNLRHHTGYGGGLFYFMAPLLVLGLWHVLRRCRRQPYYRFLLLALLSYPLAACLMMERTHSTRCLTGPIFWGLLALLGAQAWQRRRGRGWRVSLLLLVGLGMLQPLGYFLDYFGDYQERSRGAYETELVEAVAAAFEELGEGETLYLSPSTVFHPVDRNFKPWTYAHLCFLGLIDPAHYQQAGLPRQRVRAYTGVIGRAGILIRADSRVTPPIDGWSRAVPNPEPIPPGAVLFRRIPLALSSVREALPEAAVAVRYERAGQETISYQLYRVPSAN